MTQAGRWRRWLGIVALVAWLLPAGAANATSLGSGLAQGADAMYTNAPQLTPVGKLPLPGFNADVWAHNGFAYVGAWGTSTGYPVRCPAMGVRIIDLADPAKPALVGAVAAIPGTSQEDVVVKRIDTAAFHGDLLVTGVQACLRVGNAPRGVDLWDVTDPRQPQHLAFWASDAYGEGGARGIHELYLFQRGDRAYIAAADPYSEQFEQTGDFRLVDVTDPRQPVQVSAWGATIDGGLQPQPGQTFFGHSAWTNAAGTLAIVSYWDAGAIFLDISDPAHPTYLGRTVYPPGFGNTHSVWLAANETVLLTADETPEPRHGAWGFLRLWDIHNLATPAQIGQFATANAQLPRQDGGDYTIHNPFVVGTLAFLSWYSDGIRVVDIANPAAPRELAAYVPPPTGDPYGEFPYSTQVWGVYATGDLVLASDINAGLYVLRYIP
jgi:hypothetical protein